VNRVKIRHLALIATQFSQTSMCNTGICKVWRCELVYKSDQI